MGMKIRPAIKHNPMAGKQFKPKFEFPEGFILVVDTREQDPLFSGKSLLKGLVVVRDTLPAGDYSVRGFETKIAIERKTIPDLLGCLGNDRDRFKRELERLRGYEWAAICLEGTLSELLQYHDFSQMHPESIRKSLVSINIRHKIQFFYDPSRPNMERWVVDHLLKFWLVKREKRVESV
jgi:ERCC4-type nuclease